MKFVVDRQGDMVTIGRPPRGGRGLKSRCRRLEPVSCQSPPSRGAWIEIGINSSKIIKSTVAPLAGGVD